MNLNSHHPYSLLKNGILHSYPSLQRDEHCEVAIIGAGVSGALVAWHLGCEGIKTIVLDKRHAGTGSTSASTALLQYEIDIPLNELIDKVGESNAVDSYQLCLDAINKIQAISKKVEAVTSFKKVPSLQYASYKMHVDKLQKEFECRKKYGLPIHWLNEQQVLAKYGFEKPGAILSDIGAQVDAYKLTHDILQYCIKNLSAKVFDKTTISHIQKSKPGFVLTSNEGFKIRCRNVVIACGYESQHYLPEKVEILKSTYAIVSEPFSNADFWHKNSLIWETSNPYLYLRTTSDQRILVGGKDIPYTNALERDRHLKQKTIALEKSFNALFPSLSFKTDFSWAGTFGATRDGLPYIGQHKSLPGIYFALGYGGNGITFSNIAGEIIRDLLTEKKNKYAPIFKFGR